MKIVFEKHQKQQKQVFDLPTASYNALCTKKPNKKLCVLELTERSYDHKTYESKHQQPQVEVVEEAEVESREKKKKKSSTGVQNLPSIRFLLSVERFFIVFKRFYTLHSIEATYISVYTGRV